VGSGLEVQGPCVLLPEGRLTIGSGLTVRSRSHNRVEIAVAAGGTLRIGDGVFLNQGARISCTRDVRIGDGCLIADECVILDTDYHAVGGKDTRVAPVVIGDRVWLATRVIVLRGVTIGEGSVIGAGSVVTRSIPSYSFAAGMPAKVIRPLR
jgi:acetyltransferase-like isoleucine patch superfamily enzyme